jgi:hypothetical protein
MERFLELKGWRMFLSSCHRNGKDGGCFSPYVLGMERMEDAPLLMSQEWKGWRMLLSLCPGNGKDGGCPIMWRHLFEYPGGT